jgi:hypothetical protein
VNYIGNQTWSKVPSRFYIFAIGHPVILSVSRLSRTGIIRLIDSYNKQYATPFAKKNLACATVF